MQLLIISIATQIFPRLLSIVMATQDVGGYRPIEDMDDPYVQEIGKFAVEEHNRQSGEALVFVRIGGEQQVVAGTNYKLVVEAEDGRGAAAANKHYEAVVYDKPWEKFRELTSFNLVPVNEQRAIKVIGGYEPIPDVKDDQHVKEIAEFAVAEYNKQTGKALVFVRVVGGEQQVVAGTNYKLVVEAKDAGVTKTYEAVVYDKPWEKVRELTSFVPLPEQQNTDRRPGKRGWYRYMCGCGKI